MKHLISHCIVALSPWEFTAASHDRHQAKKRLCARTGWNIPVCHTLMSLCPGFGQDRVNFHQNPRRGTAGRADPTWPNRAGYSIPCAVMLGSGWGELGGGNSLTARGRAAAAGGESCSLHSAVCVVYSLYLYRCCYCSLCLLLC